MVRPGALVEIIEENSTPDRAFVCPQVVRINGTDVGLIAEGGIRVDSGSLGKMDDM